jgi:ribosomal protein S27AE
MTDREQWFCTNCGTLRFTAEQPDICEHCGRGTERAKHRVVGGKTTEFKRVVEERELDSEIPEATEECPGCGADVDPDEITHELGGGFCIECS